MAKLRFETDLIEKHDGFYVRTIIEGQQISEVGPIPTFELAERVQSEAHESTIKILGEAKERLLADIKKMGSN